MNLKMKPLPIILISALCCQGCETKGPNGESRSFKETFKETLKLTQDLAAVGFGSMKTAALQLGKALEDPETGLSALRRVGVSFTEQQKDQIKVLAMTGRQMEAQAIIIKTLKQQVGGAGEGAAGGLAGAYDTLKENMALFFEQNAFGAMIVSKLTDGLNVMNEALGNQLRQVKELPDNEKELNEVRQETLKIIHQEIDDLHTMIARKEKLGILDAKEFTLLTKQIIQKKFDIKLNSKILEDIKAKTKALDEEIPIINKADEIRAIKDSLSNPAANLPVAMKAAEMQMEQTDQALANTLDTIRATGSGAGGATALAQAAAQSKSKVAASIQQQEATNAKAAAQGEAQLQSDRANIEAKAIAEEIGAYGRQEKRDIVQLNRMQSQIENAQAREASYEQAASDAISEGLGSSGTALSGADFTSMG